MIGEYYERPELVDGLTFVTGLVSFLFAFALVLLIGVVFGSKNRSHHEDVHDVADPHNDDYFDKIKDFQDDFQ